MSTKEHGEDTGMKERPIIYSGAMVIAVHEDRKSMTRRPNGLEIINQNPDNWKYGGVNVFDQHIFYPTDDDWYEKNDFDGLVKCPYGITGTLFFVKGVGFEITGVRAERLREITEEDAMREGVDAISLQEVPRQATWSRRQDFSQLWDSIYSKTYPWESNPWVWVISFRRIPG